MLGIDSKVARSAWSHAAIYGLVALAACLLWVIRKTLIIFAAALMLAYLVYPLVEFFERRLPCKSRTPAVIVPFLLMVSLVGGMGFAIERPVKSEIQKLHDQLTMRVEGKPTFPEQVAAWEPMGIPVGKHLVEMDVFGKAVAAVPRLKETFTTGLRYLANLFIVPLLSFLVLKDGRRIRDAALGILGNRQRLEGILMDAHVLLLEYMRALLLLCLATLVSYSAAFALMGVKYALLLAMAAFALEFVPLVGPLTAAALILGISEFNHSPHLLWVVAFLAAYRVVQDYVLSPLLMKRGVDLDPLLVIFGVFAGAEIGGVAGVFLSVPVLALSRLVFYELKGRPRASCHAAGNGIATLSSACR